MNNSTLTVLFCICTALLGCDESMDDPSVALDARVANPALNQKPTHGYYTATRDLRRCSFPECGGWFISAVNEPFTTCSDGNLHSECYVAKLQMPDDVEQGDHDLLQATVDTTVIGGQLWGRLNVEVAYESLRGHSNLTGRYNLIHEAGVQCVIAPCPDHRITELNRGNFSIGTPFIFWGEGLTDDDSAMEDGFWSQYFADDHQSSAGALTFGEHWTVGEQTSYSIYDVYQRKLPAGSHGDAAVPLDTVEGELRVRPLPGVR